MTYSLQITKKQTQVIQRALEIYARLGIGQSHDALDALPIDDKASYEWYNTKMLIGDILKAHTKRGVDGWQSSLSICGDDVNSDHQIAWDIYAVIMKKLSWELAVKYGHIESENSPRNWKKMMGVNYDDPFKTGPEPLAEMKAVEKEI